MLEKDVKVVQLRSIVGCVWLTEMLASPHLISTGRTIQNSLLQMEVILSQPTQQLQADPRTLFGVREDSNPMLHVPVQKAEILTRITALAVLDFV
ncbi:hypothetical protein EMCRGX_G019048 [Ephydatia muelleri]